MTFSGYFTKKLTVSIRCVLTMTLNCIQFLEFKMIMNFINTLVLITFILQCEV